jgi:GNAT superfamily N-acetyltransferase
LASNLSTALALVRLGRFDVLYYEVKRRIRSEVTYIGGALDLEEFSGLATASQDFSLRPVTPSDHPYFTDFRSSDLDVIGVLLRINAARRLASRMLTCYVVTQDDGRPCHMEYLVRPEDFHTVEEFSPGRFPVLQEEEALLEYPYTTEECRGRGVALFAMAALAAKAKSDGVRRLVMFAPTDNIQMLRLCEWAGFVPFIEREERFVLFRSRMTFRELPVGATYPRTTESGPARRRSAG